MMRITTNSTLRTYQTGLYKSTNRLYSSMSKMMSGRNFDSYAADPAGATRAFKIHSSLNATRAQAANNETVLNKFQTAWSIEQEVLGQVQELGQQPALGGLNGTNHEDTVLDSYAQVLRAGAESIVQSLNGKYDDAFIFNGAETGEAPFAIVNNELTFRGFRVNVPDDGNTYVDANGQSMINPDTNQPYTNAEVRDKLEAMAGENLWVDIGIGFRLDEATGEVVDSTAYDSALSGLNVLGYGQDADGDPQDIVSIMLELADVYEGYDGGAWTNGGQDVANRLVQKFTDAQGHLISQNTSLDAKADYLETNQARLENTFDNLDMERGSIEDIDQVAVIQELVWNQTCYNAALQVGSSVIPQSLMDYMR